MGDLSGSHGFGPAQHDRRNNRRIAHIGSHPLVVLDAILHDDDATGLRTTRSAKPIGRALGVMCLGREQHPVPHHCVRGIGKCPMVNRANRSVGLGDAQTIEGATRTQHDLVIVAGRFDREVSTD